LTKKLNYSEKDPLMWCSEANRPSYFPKIETPIFVVSSDIRKVQFSFKTLDIGIQKTKAETR
jgi:hypothetical protein